MPVYFLLLFFISSSVYASVCPQNFYLIHPKGPQKVSRTYVVPECYPVKFYYRGCQQFYDDLICYFVPEGGKYELFFIQSGGYGSEIPSDLSFHHSKPDNCAHKPTFKYVEDDDVFIHKVQIKNKEYRFERTGCTKSSHKLPRTHPNGEKYFQNYTKTRCEYRNSQLKELRLIETALNNGLKMRRYLVGCR